MKKRQLLALAVITAIMAMLFMFPITGHAVIGMGTIEGTEIQWVIEDNGKLTITGSGEIPDRVTYDTDWFVYKDQITALEVSGTITRIGSSAFITFTSLKTATICDTVTSIGNAAFWGCTALETLKLPASLDTMGTEVLFRNDKLTAVTLSSTNTNFKVEDGVLSDAAETTIYWAGGITESTYYIPNTYTTIDGSVFIASTALTSVYVPDTVTTIGRLAFEGVDNVYGVEGSALETYATENEITLTDTFKGMCGSTVFFNMSAKKGINGTIITLTITGKGKMTDYNKSTPAPWSGLVTALYYVRVDAGVTSVGSQAFKGATSLTSVTLPSSVTSIGESAFEGCTSLTEITLPAKLRTINQEAFANTGLTTIVIPATVTSLHLKAFSGCASLGGIVIPSTNTSYASVNGVVFSKDKTQLLIYPGGKTDETYTIPSDVTHIYAGFEGNSSLKYVYIPKSVTSIFSGVFSSCDGLTVYGYTGTAAETYASNNSITFVPMNGTIDNTDITWYYDYITQKLTVSGTGTVPASALGELWMVFADTTKIISIEEGITALSTNSFPLHNALETVYFPTTLTAIRIAAFYSASEPDVTVIYAGSPDEWDDVFVGSTNQIIDNATVTCEQTVSIDSIATGTNTIFVSTTNIDDGRKIAVATYSSNGKMLSFNYVEITNNIGQLSVSTENVGYIKAFYMNASSPRPYCNVYIESVG